MEQKGKYQELLWCSMLGNFSLTYRGKTVTLDKEEDTGELLAYLLLHRERGVGPEELIETKWDTEDIAAKVESLPERVAALLEPLLGNEQPPVFRKDGLFYLNPSIPFTLDTEEMERLLMEAEQEIGETAAAHFKTMLSLYQGELLPTMAESFWVIPLAEKYHRLHLYGVKQLVEYYQEQGQLEIVLNLCQEAVRFHPVEEWLHSCLVEVLIELGDVSAAARHYAYITDLRYRNLGIPPTEELAMLSQRLGALKGEKEHSLEEICRYMEERETEMGAFVCGYSVFKELYLLERRRAQRSGGISQLVLLTLSAESGEALSPNVIQVAMDYYLSTLTTKLRSGDAICRCSDKQFLVLLPGASEENAKIALQRVGTTLHHESLPMELTFAISTQEIAPGR